MFLLGAAELVSAHWGRRCSLSWAVQHHAAVCDLMGGWTVLMHSGVKDRHYHQHSGPSNDGSDEWGVSSLTHFSYLLLVCTADLLCCGKWLLGRSYWPKTRGLGPKFWTITEDRQFHLVESLAQSKAGVFVALTRISHFFYSLFLFLQKPWTDNQTISKSEEEQKWKMGEKKAVEVKIASFPAASVLQRDMNAKINQRKWILHVDGFILQCTCICWLQYLKRW